MKLFFTATLACLLTACATKPASVAPLNKALSWPQRQEENACITRWNITGAAVIRTPQESLSVSLIWQQFKQKEYVISLMGPLNSGAILLTGDNQHITLKTSDGRISNAVNAEALMQQELQWSLPISPLFYWIRGLSAPHSHANIIFDAYNHIQKLEQDGWKVDYIKYTNVNGVDLPSKIFMDNATTHVRIIITRWIIEKKCMPQLTDASKISTMPTYLA